MNGANERFKAEGHQSPIRLSDGRGPNFRTVDDHARIIQARFNGRNFGPKAQRGIGVASQIDRAGEIRPHTIHVRRIVGCPRVTDARAVGFEYPRMGTLSTKSGIDHTPVSRLPGRVVIPNDPIGQARFKTLEEIRRGGVSAKHRVEQQQGGKDKGSMGIC